MSLAPRRDWGRKYYLARLGKMQLPTPPEGFNFAGTWAETWARYFQWIRAAAPDINLPAAITRWR